MIPNTKITIGHQAVKISSNDHRLKLIVMGLFNHLTYYEMVANPVTKRYEKEAKGFYYIFKEDGINFDFIISINNLNDILYLLKTSSLDKTGFSISNRVYKNNKVRIPLYKEFTPREGQRFYIDNIVKTEDVYNMLIDLQPGYGKTLIGYFSSVELGNRVAILVKPAYLKKWVEDIKKYSPLEDTDYYIIKGGNSLTKLFDMKKQDRDKIKMYVISTRTISLYFDNYYSNDFKYKITPYQFMEYCGINNVLNDESHKEFETVFKILLWMDPERIIGLSATMDSDKRNMNYFYNLLWPRKNRLVSLFGIRKFANMLFYFFSLNDGIFIPHKGFMGYNHIKYEQNILRNTKLLQDYIKMILFISEKYYNSRRTDGRKLLILFSTIDMCTMMTNAFTKEYPNLSVKRYVEKDSYEEMLTGDIVISTNGSTGTAIDIPGLITAIQTVPISDKQLNIQALGRLRERPGEEVLYISLYCENLKAHKDNKEKRFHILKDRVVTITTDRYHEKLGNVGALNVNAIKTYKDFSNGFQPRHFKKYNSYSNKARR